MADFRDMTPEEITDWMSKHHECRALDSFECPYCGANSGATYSDGTARVEKCHQCGLEYFAWTVPGTVCVTATKRQNT